MIDNKKFLSQMLDGYRANYDITEHEGQEEGLVAEAHMHVEESQCVVFEEFKMWKADADEYVYIFRTPHFTEELADQYMDFTVKDGEPKIDLEHVNIKQQHMCTHLVCLVLCDEADEAALKKMKKCKVYKNFMFGLKGWMDMHTAVLNLTDESIVSNRYGKGTADYLKLHLQHYKKTNAS